MSQKTVFEDKWHRSFMGQMTNVTSSQQCHNTDRKKDETE